MTESRLKDLLNELADDAPGANLSRVEAAWRSSRRRRDRARVVAAAGASAMVVIGGVVITQPPWRDRGVPEPPRVASPTPSAPLTTSSPDPSPTPPDTFYGGVPVWWAPPAEKDAALALLTSRIPSVIDLSAGQQPVQAGEVALGVYQVTNLESEQPLRFVVVTADGATRELPAERIVMNRDEAGNAAGLLRVSPSGRYVAFSQPSSLEVYDLAAAHWTSIDTPDWVAEGARWIGDDTLWVPRELTEDAGGTTYGVDGRRIESATRPEVPDLAIAPGDAPYAQAPTNGPDGAIAAGYFLHGPIDGGRYSNPEGIVARIGDTTAVLAFDITGRNKGCCSVAGWLDEDTVGFTTNGRLLAWRVGTNALFRVSQTTGLDLGTEVAGADWAWKALY